MACTRHRKRVEGETVQVVRGLAKDVKRIADSLRCESVTYVHIGQSPGGPRIGLRWGKTQSTAEKLVVRVKVCDPDHGEGDIKIRTRHPAAIAYMLRKQMSRDKGMANYLEQPPDKRRRSK